MTLGQPAADVLVGLLGLERVLVARDSTYGAQRVITSGGRELTWLALKHPGQRQPAWEAHHRAWVDAQ